MKNKVHVVNTELIGCLIRAHGQCKAVGLRVHVHYWLSVT